LLTTPVVQQRAAEVGEVIQQEDGVAVACALLEDVLDRVRPLTAPSDRTLPSTPS
jgi:hypothetical protein